MAKTKEVSVWEVKGLKGRNLNNFLNYINRWAKFYEDKETLDIILVTAQGKPNHITDYGRGYQKAVTDIWSFLNPKFIELRRIKIKEAN